MPRFTFKACLGAVLPLSLFIAGLAMWPQLGSSIAAESLTPPKGAGAKTMPPKTIQMQVAGMTCAACARGLEASLRKMAGVGKAAIDYNTGQAVITYDPAKQTAENLSKLVADCGYQVKSIKVD